MNIKLNIDTERLTAKPATFDGRLRLRLCSKDSIRTVTPELFIQAVQKGCTFTPAVMTGTTGDTWQSQQVICADIDNDTGRKDENGDKIPIDKPLTPSEALQVMQQYDITPYFMYYSFSNSEACPKFRIVLILDEPLTDPDEANDLINRFTGIFNTYRERCADSTASDNARMYYGGTYNSVFFDGGTVTDIEKLRQLPKIDSTPQKAPDTTARGAFSEHKEYKRTATPQKRHTGAYRAYNDLLAEFERDKETFDLADYIEQTTGSQPVRRGRATFFNPCPICGHNDDCQVTGSIYHCHSASGGSGGTIIDYLMNRNGYDKGKACDVFKYEIMNYDRNEWQQAYKAEHGGATPEPSEAEQQPEEQTPNSASDYLSGGQFQKDIEYFKQYQDRKTGFTAIDEHLTLYPGLAALGGASSLGKTTFAVNLIDRLLDRGETVLYFSLEQLPIEIITKSLTRALYEADPLTPLTNTDVKNGATSPELETIKQEYAEKAKNYHIVTGSFRTTAADIVQYVENYRAQHDGVKPIVIIDYLQLIAPPQGFRGDVRGYTDENIKALKDMQKRNELFVLIISSFNRSSNYTPVSYESFKETSMIEYTCDFIWGLQLAILDAENDDFYTKTGVKGGQTERPLDEKRKLVNEAQSATPKKIEFVSLKNRNGRQFFKAFFDYYPQYDCYIEENEAARDETFKASPLPFDGDDDDIMYL